MPYGGAPYGGVPYGGTEVGGTNYPESVSDSVSITDAAIISSRHDVGIGSDSIVISDSVQWKAYLLPYARIPGTYAHATPRTRNPVNFPRGFRVSRVKPPANLYYTAFDSFSFADSARISGIGTHLTTNDIVAFADSVKEYRSFMEAATESFTIADTLAYIRGFSAYPTDSVSISDVISQTGISTHIKTNDSLSLSDQARVSSTLGRSADSLSISDTARGTLGTNFNFSSDSIAISDSTTGTLGTNFNFSSDSVTILDKALLGINGYENIAIADVAILRLPSALDSISFSDNGTIVAGANRAFLWQLGYEASLQTNSAASIYQLGSEVAAAFTGNAALYQIGNEIAAAFTSGATLYQYGLEVPDTTPSAMCIYQAGVEVIVTPIWGNRIAPPAILAPKGPPLRGSPISRTAIPAPTIFGTPTLVSG